MRAFDTGNAGTVQATGFVVDAERGYIMTNRHVAGPGPLVADAIFANNEEVPLTVVYYDPVHDFALFSFDPAAIKHMTVSQIELAPDEAALGADVVRQLISILPLCHPIPAAFLAFLAHPGR